MVVCQLAADGLVEWVVSSEGKVGKEGQGGMGGSIRTWMAQPVESSASNDEKYSHAQVLLIPKPQALKIKLQFKTLNPES